MMLATSVSTRTIEFLNESNRIEGIHEIDYADLRFQDLAKGHFGAFLLSQEAGLNHTPLTAKILRTLQGLLGKEQQERSGTHIGNEEIGHIRGPSLQKNVRIGSHVPPSYEHVPLLLMNWVEDINEDLAKNHELYAKDDKAFAKFAGSYFLRFERIHPFGDGNGRMGRLIANYLSTYCNRPLLLFPSNYSIRNRYLEAHESEKAMENYFFARMAEA